MLTAQEIDQMSADEKLEAVDQILSSFGKNNADSPSPDWHKDILSERMRLIDSGEAEWLSLEQFNEEINKLTS